MSWTRSERRLGAKTALGASSKPMAASERDLAVQTAIGRLEANLDRMAAEADRLAGKQKAVDPKRDLRVTTAKFFKLGAVARAAEVLFKANQLEMGAVEMNRRWKALEDALNEWRAK